MMSLINKLYTILNKPEMKNAIVVVVKNISSVAKIKSNGKH